MLEAKLAESFKWVRGASIRGFVLYRDGVTLPGMLSLHLGALRSSSFEAEWQRYSTQHATIYTKLDDKGKAVFDRIEWGPFSDATRDEARNAIWQLLDSTT